MGLKNFISLILFSTFLIAYILKLLILYKRDKVQANVLARGKKGNQIKGVEAFVKTTTFIWGIVWLAEIFGENFIEGYLMNLTDIKVLDYIELFVIFFGVVIFILAMTSMKTSWRVGIDKSSKTKLVTQGIYRLSRNPAFVGFNLMFMGVFITYPNILTILVMAINMMAIHLLIRQEEIHLEEVFGKEYTEYRKIAPRYFLF